MVKANIDDALAKIKRDLGEQKFAEVSDSVNALLALPWVGGAIRERLEKILKLVASKHVTVSRSTATLDVPSSGAAQRLKAASSSVARPKTEVRIAKKEVESTPSEAPKIVSPLKIRLPLRVQGTEDQPFDMFVEADGGTPPYVHTAILPDPPAGLLWFPGLGKLSGHPTNDAVGVCRLFFVVEDSGTPPQRQIASVDVEILPQSELDVPEQVLEDARALEYYEQNFTIYGGRKPYYVEVIEGSLPDGLRLGAESASVFGFPKPESAGVHEFAIRVRDSSPVPFQKLAGATLNVAKNPNYRLAGEPEATEQQELEEAAQVEFPEERSSGEDSMDSILDAFDAEFHEQDFEAAARDLGSGIGVSPMDHGQDARATQGIPPYEPAPEGEEVSAIYPKLLASGPVLAGSLELHFVTEALPAFDVEREYNPRIEVAGGTEPYFYSLSEETESFAKISEGGELTILRVPPRETDRKGIVVRIMDGFGAEIEREFPFPDVRARKIRLTLLASAGGESVSLYELADDRADDETRSLREGLDDEDRLAILKESGALVFSHFPDLETSLRRTTIDFRKAQESDELLISLTELEKIVERIRGASSEGRELDTRRFRGDVRGRLNVSEYVKNRLSDRRTEREFPCVVSVPTNETPENELLAEIVSLVARELEEIRALLDEDSPQTSALEARYAYLRDLLADKNLCKTRKFRAGSLDDSAPTRLLSASERRIEKGLAGEASDDYASLIDWFEDYKLRGFRKIEVSELESFEYGEKFDQTLFRIFALHTLGHVVRDAFAGDLATFRQVAVKEHREKPIIAVTTPLVHAYISFRVSIDDLITQVPALSLEEKLASLNGAREMMPLIHGLLMFQSKSGGKKCVIIETDHNINGNIDGRDDSILKVSGLLSWYEELLGGDVIAVSMVRTKDDERTKLVSLPFEGKKRLARFHVNPRNPDQEARKQLRNFLLENIPMG
ncbi:MAG: hypothetical protein NUW37_02670 [Planctomycetes bacterium]|nr:hypothetical protein [Planctomycetota bacterium]